MKPTDSEKTILVIKGIFYSNLLAFAGFALAHFIMHLNTGVGGVLIFSEFVLLPIGMGLVAVKYWRRFSDKTSSYFVWSLVNTLTGILLSAVFMGEGYICLLIVSPLILGFMWVGIAWGKYMYKQGRGKIRASTFLLLLGIFVYDTFSEHHYENMVGDEMVVNAPPEVVWRYIGAHPENKTEPEYWLFKIGLPYPIQSTAGGDSIGVWRKCIFSNNAVFDEVVSEYEKYARYTFDVTKQPDDPEIVGHIAITRGQFILKENPDGSTLLTGISWYRLNVFPVWYYDLWAEDITRKVHIRVMEHIKILAENDKEKI
ncbi:SRPBCC family protein [Cytophagaceae bacterium ABcell3]|nr:SRPBCC family protein [Cytophagaceae bacterium ABcell3]